MELEYLPGTGFRIDQLDLVWGMSREDARQKLGMPHEVDDRVLDLKKYFPDENKPPIRSWRDIYSNWHGGDNHFFLNYDHEQRLAELEVHWGMSIRISSVVLSFEQPLPEALERLREMGLEHRSVDEGELFEREKFSLSDNDAMGGDGDGIAYFYAANDITHLLEDL